jgi:hypothetical protein
MAELKREGFSYESPEKQRKSAAKLITVELIALIVVVILIIGLLQYLKIINVFSLINNEKTSSIPSVNLTKPEKPMGQRELPKNTRNTETKSVQPSVLVVSDSSQLSIKENQPQILLQFVKPYDIFGKRYLLKPGEFSDFVDTLELHLTDVVQPSNKYFLKDVKTPVTSSMITFQEGKLIIKIYLSKEAYENPKITPEKFFMQSLLSDVYQMSKDPSGIGLKPEQQKELNDEIGKIYLDKTGYITIVRK